MLLARVAPLAPLGLRVQQAPPDLQEQRVLVGLRVRPVLLELQVPLVHLVPKERLVRPDLVAHRGLLV